MSELRVWLERELERLESAGLSRALQPPSGRDFTSNDTLGLSKHPRVQAAAKAAIDDEGVGATASRLLRGHHPVHAQAESIAAGWLETEATLLCASGWAANTALIPALTSAEDIVLSDALNHASIVDACRLSRARVRVVPHLDLVALRTELTRFAHVRRRWVVVEGYYSMDADRPNFPDLLALADEFDAYVIVDEAHAAGIWGDRSAGSSMQFRNHPRLVARVVTGGKALGAGGAIVAGTWPLVRWVLNRGRPFIYSTGVALPVAAALATSIDVVQDEPERVSRVHTLANRFRRQLADRGTKALGEGPIVPVICGDASVALKSATVLQAQGFDVRAVRPPTVPDGSSRLRIVIHADHDEADLDALATAIVRLELGVKPRDTSYGRARLSAGSPDVPPGVVRQQNPSRGVVVLGTDTNVGKTVASAMCLRALALAGTTACYLKPIQTGLDSDTDRIAELTATQPPNPLVSLPLPASVDQAAASAGRCVRVSTMVSELRSHLAQKPDLYWVVETAGGLLVPLNDTEDQSDWVRAINWPTVVVARSGLGTLNHTRLTLEAAARRGIAVAGLLLVGDAHPENVKTLSTWFPRLCILSVPHWNTLSTDSIDAWCREHPLASLLLEGENAI